MHLQRIRVLSLENLSAPRQNSFFYKLAAVSRIVTNVGGEYAVGIGGKNDGKLQRPCTPDPQPIRVPNFGIETIPRTANFPPLFDQRTNYGKYVLSPSAFENSIKFRASNRQDLRKGLESRTVSVAISR